MKEFWIDESQIAKYLYNRLIEDGYAPAADEILDIAEYVFDFLMEASYIQQASVDLDDDDYDFEEDE